MFLAWDSDDQDKALAWRALQAERCAGCGTLPELWDPRQGGDPHALVPEPRRCRGCELIGQAQRDLERGDDPGLGVRIALVPNIDDGDDDGPGER